MDSKVKNIGRVLFIGNSATYVHDIPQTLQTLAHKAGYTLTADSIARGGYELVQHANAESEHGAAVYAKIAEGYDIVILQDNGNAISTSEKSKASLDACQKLAAAAREAGSRVYIYVRPPYGRVAFGKDVIEQSAAFDGLFVGIAEKIGAGCVFVNRAFAYAMKKSDARLWGPDNGHTSEVGAYLAVCTFFASLFGTSADVLEDGGIDPATAKQMRDIADKITFG